MSKIIFKTVIVIMVSATLFIQFSSCKKEEVKRDAPICVIRGVYSGTNQASTGLSSTLTYNFKDNNFAVGSVTPTGQAVTFGSYTNTCDSVLLTVYYNANSSYYTLRGKLSNNNATISGTFINTTTAEYGTFNISK